MRWGFLTFLMRYEGVSFNEEVVASFQNAEAMVESVEYRDTWPKVSREVEKQRLKQVYELVTGNSSANDND